MRRFFTTLLSILLLACPLLSSPPLLASSNISILETDTSIRFPVELIFHLEAESPAEITSARLLYRVHKMNYAPIISEGWAVFSPSTSIRVSWSWDMRRASLPPGAEITYWWVIEDSAGKTINSRPTRICFNDTRYEWQSLQEDNLTLFWYQGNEAFAEELLDACSQGLARLTDDIGARSQNPIRIYVYASAAEVREAMIFPQEWTGGVAFTEFGTVAIGISQENTEWGKRALVHELTHLVVHQATFSPYGRLPTWLDEGLAVYNEGAFNPTHRYWLEKAISDDRLISVRSLASPFSADPEKAYISYAQSRSLVAHLLNNYGQDSMLRLLELFKQGTTCDEALKAIYDLDMDKLEQDWQRSLVT